MDHLKLFFSRVPLASPSGEVENIEVRKRKYGSEKGGFQTLPVWVEHPAHTGKVWKPTRV